MKKGKSAGVDNIQAELVQAGGEDVITALTTICNKIWQTGKWPTAWTQSSVITLPKKGNLQQCQNYRTISLINHPSKVMLKIILNRLKPQAEKIIAKERKASEQDGVPQSRSSTYAFYVRNISSTSKTSTMSSKTSRKSAGVNIPAELVQAGGEDVFTALTTTCNKI